VVVDEVKKLFYKKKKTSIFIPEWKKEGANEADIYFKSLQSSWE